MPGQAPTEPERSPQAFFSVVIEDVRGVKKVDGHRSPRVEQPRFGEAKVIAEDALAHFPFGADFLPSAEKVGFLHFDVSHEFVDGRIAAAQADGTGLALLNAVNQHGLSRLVAGFHFGIDLIEETKVVKISRRSTDTRRLELIARLQVDLAPDDVIPGLVVADNLDVLDKGNLAFHDLQVKVRGFGFIVVIGLVDDIAIDIALIQVKGTNALEGILHVFLLERLPRFEMGGFRHVVVGDDGISFEGKLAHLIGDALPHDDFDVDGFTVFRGLRFV